MKRAICKDRDYQGRNERGRRVWYEVVFFDEETIGQVGTNYKEYRSLKAALRLIRKYQFRDYMLMKKYYQRRQFVEYESIGSKLIQVVSSFWQIRESDPKR